VSTARKPSAPAPAASSPTPETTWSPESWRERPQAQAVQYPDAQALDGVLARLRALPPLVTSWEIERLRSQIVDAQVGKRFLLQGGDCAETFTDCRPDVLSAKLKILLQMSLVLIHGGSKPVIRVGRFAGQYAKPRSNAVEVRDGQTLPSYFGDLVNRQEFTAAGRAPDPELLLAGYMHAALTINFVRSLAAGGFADLHHPEFWDLSSLGRADLAPQRREEYARMVRQLGEALRFMEALGESTIDDLTRVEFFASHEGLSLAYEAAQTRRVPRRDGFYDLTTHLPWIGERTRALDGAHVEFFRGVRNPVGVKIGPKTTPDDLVRLVDRLNPDNEPGKLLLVARMGAARVAEALPPLLDAIRREGRVVLWVCDPMHGNGRVLPSGVKTRDFEDILREVETFFDAHAAAGTIAGGVHFELTGDDVTECVGAGLTEADLDRNYVSACDPRLNYRQALEMAFRISARMRR
jgi:3-deoxy-7-phosphoheptulonate synthase